MKAAILLTLLLATTLAVKQPADPTKWVPTEYTELMNDSSLNDWTFGYRIGPKVKEGFVGDTCNDIAVYGANVAGKNTPIKTNISLDGPIYSYIIESTVWMIDSYDNESIVGNVNGDRVFEFSKAHDEGEDLCGNVHKDYWRDLSKKVIIENKLSADEFEFELTSTLDQAPHDESIGMSEFRLWVAYCHPVCASCDGQGNGNCIECIEGYQKDDHGSCIPQDMGLTLTIDDPEEFATLGTFTIGEITYAEGDEFPGQQCGDHQVFGAGVASHYIQAEFKPNPRATKCAVQFDLWMIDSWDKESLFAVFQGDKIAHLMYDVDEEGIREDQCGRDIWGDRTFRVLSHMVPYEEGESLLLQVGSSLDQDAGDESFGISNVRLFCEVCHPSCDDCTKSNSKINCSACHDDELLHVINPERYDGVCVKPSGACHKGFLRDDGICEQMCDYESAEAAAAIPFLQNQEPRILAETKRDFVHITFQIDLPDTCYRGYIWTLAGWEPEEYEFTLMYASKDKKHWQSDLFLMDHQLNDPQICETHRDNENDTTVYKCDLEFYGYYGIMGTLAETWESTIEVTFHDDLPVGVKVIREPRHKDDSEKKGDQDEIFIEYEGNQGY